MGRSAAVTAPLHNDAISAASSSAGGPSKLAVAIGVHLQKVAGWLGGADIEPDLCPAIEQATGVKCDDLRPDLLWVRDGSGEILAFATPVDGADATYVRQALASTPVESATTERAASPEPRVDTVFGADRLLIKGQDGGDVLLTIDVGVRQAVVLLDATEARKVASDIAHSAAQVESDSSGQCPATAHQVIGDCTVVGDVVLDVAEGMVRLAIDGSTVWLGEAEASELAGSILDHREKAIGLLPSTQWVEVAEKVVPLLPLKLRKDDAGITVDVTCTRLSSPATVFRQTDRGGGYCVLRVGGTEVLLAREEADALAYALNAGNDGSGMAHIAKLACADMSEAIKLLRGGDITGVSTDDVANKLASKVSVLLDLHYQYQQHTYRRHGNLRAGRAPAVEAADRLGECSRKAIEVISTVCGSMARGNWKDEHGNELTKRGMYRDLRNAQRALDAAANEVMVKGEDAKAQQVEWRNPLEAQAMKSDAHHVSYMTNLEWKPDSEATVSNCLEEASLTISTACKIILGNMYDESEDQMSMLLGMAKASVACAHSKLIQFASEGRDAS